MSLDQYQQHRLTVNTLTLTDIGILTYDMVLSNHATITGAKGHRNAYLHSKDICSAGSCCKLLPDDAVTKCPWSPPEP